MSLRPPSRKLSDVIRRLPSEALEKRADELAKVAARSTRLFFDGRVRTSRGHAQSFVSPYGIAPIHPDVQHGFWAVHKPAFVPMRTADLDPTPPQTSSPRRKSTTAAGTVADDAANAQATSSSSSDRHHLHRGWTLERYLAEAPVPQAAFGRGERLDPLFDLDTDASGLIVLAVDLPAALQDPRRWASAELINSVRFEVMVWGHLRHNPRPLLVDGIALSDFVSTVDIAAEAAGERGVGGSLSVSVPRIGFYCGHPASVVHLFVHRPDPSLIGRIDWSALVKAATQQAVPASRQRHHQTAGVRTSVPPAFGADGTARLVGHAVHDDFGRELELDVPRMMVNLYSASVTPLARAMNAFSPEGDTTAELPEPFDLGAPRRFDALLAERPPLSDAASMVASKRRLIV